MLLVPKQLLVVLVLLICSSVGCCYKTDKLLVFEEGVLKDEEVEKLVGTYQLTQNALNLRGGQLRLEKKGPVSFASLTLVGQEGKTTSLCGPVIVSYIPKTTTLNIGYLRIPWWKRHDTLLVSFPSLENRKESKSEKNLFLLAKHDGKKLELWVVNLISPILQGRIEPRLSQDVFEVNELKRFLRRHADTYTQNHQPIFTFAKE